MKRTIVTLILYLKVILLWSTLSTLVEIVKCHGISHSEPSESSTHVIVVSNEGQGEGTDNFHFDVEKNKWMTSKRSQSSSSDVLSSPSFSSSSFPASSRGSLASSAHTDHSGIPSNDVVGQDNEYFDTVMTGRGGHVSDSAERSSSQESPYSQRQDTNKYQQFSYHPQSSAHLSLNRGEMDKSPTSTNNMHVEWSLHPRHSKTEENYKRWADWYRERGMVEAECCPSVGEWIYPKGGVSKDGRILELFRSNATQSFFQVSCLKGFRGKRCLFMDLNWKSRCVQRYSYTYAIVREFNAPPEASWRLDQIQIRSGCTCQVQLYQKRNHNSGERTGRKNSLVSEPEVLPDGLNLLSSTESVQKRQA